MFAILKYKTVLCLKKKSLPQEGGGQPKHAAGCTTL